MVPSPTAAETLPVRGDMVRVRSRRWLVEDVVKRPPTGSPLVKLACADDDAQGQELEVFWNYEIDRKILAEEKWADIASKGFDRPRNFAAFLHTMRWNCVTATDPGLVQSPFRAGIKLEAYQIEPLRKALQLPLVNLFIADDTGLGKTIEAGLVASELLLRKKVQTIVVSAPPSVLGQWRAELEERFGLVFEILDRQYVARMRRTRGFGINPWKTHSRFLVSHNLLTDAAYADPMRAWLGDRKPGSLLILDEAHHAAPSSGGRYGIETKITRAIRDLSARFEHRLFLSATPHNGHSSSFSTLLELLDPHRFTRGVKVRKGALREVMVRRLKDDIRKVQGGFPARDVRKIVLDGLPEDAPELVLSRLLDKYRTTREKRFKSHSRRGRASAALLVIGLQQRLLSSIEALAQSLEVHSKTALRQRRKELPAASAVTTSDRSLLTKTAGTDDEQAEWKGEDIEREERRQIELATVESEAESSKSEEDERLWQEEVALRKRMQAIANKARSLPDPKVKYLLEWIRRNLCPGLGASGSLFGPLPKWNDRRVLIFTENRQSTKKYLREMIEGAIAGTDRAEERLEVIDGLTSTLRRKEIQQRFNAHPSKDPLRILLATDAAREGLNFQAHCADLFHYDLPWNPGRIEQRNGRIDRKLQPEPRVRCHYFVLPQRAEDHVLEVLVRKTKTIKSELGSLATVIDESIEHKLRKRGIRHADIRTLARELEAEGSWGSATELKAAVQEELESVRKRESELHSELDRCRRVLDRSGRHVNFNSEHLRDALSCSLELLGADPLKESHSGPEGARVWIMPPLDRRGTTDPSWTRTLDTLRKPKKRDEKLSQWRSDAPIRPVVFEDRGVLSDETVHLHLEQRMVQRLLARFRTQGFVHHDLSRACLAQAQDPIPRVILLGRLLLYGSRAERLHEEVIPVAARWIDPSRRSGTLKAFALQAERRTLRLLEESLELSRTREPSETVRNTLLASAGRDINELLEQLEPRAREAANEAERALQERGEIEQSKSKDTLREQRKRVVASLEKEKERSERQQLNLLFKQAEIRQLRANMRSWERRIKQFDRDIETVPERVRSLYEVHARRVEPVGLVYLWPESN